MKLDSGRWVIVVVCLATVFLLSSVSSAQEKTIRLRFASFWSPAHEFSAIEKEWCADVEKKTNGRVKVSYYPGGTLAPPTQIYDSMLKGVFDIGAAPFAYNYGRFPGLVVLDLPLRYRDGVQATGMVNALIERFKLKELDGMKLFLAHSTGPCLIHTKKKIASVNELTGLRIKTTGLSAKIIEALGGTPVTMPITDVYDALAKGLADGLYLNVETLKTFKFADYLKFTLNDHGVSSTVTCWIGMNKQKWESLPKDIQRIMDDLSKEYAVKFGKLHAEIDKEGEEYAKQAGVTFTNVPKAQEEKTAEKLKPLFEAYVKDTKGKGIPGDEILKFSLQYLKTH
jgi:TRAP-type C4-dicarboxylate transport system substrate-binding protein